ncbi:MAG: hydrogenase [Gracilibacter sp. BRH_c7a]|nr:MAG: hydrogenase [Gracilibacter sp. BRH_c7a]
MLTAQIKSLEDLETIKRSYHEELKTFKYQILICGGIKCTSSQGDEVKNTVAKLIRENHLENQVVIIETGCMGICAHGPVMVIMPDEILYTQLNSEKVAEIFQAHIIDGQVKEEYTFFDPELDENIPKITDIDFLRYQVKVALKNCGIIDYSSIEAYIAKDGYSAVVKVLKSMDNRAVIEEVKKSTLRGRGDGGTPIGITWEQAMKVKSDPKYIVCETGDGDSKISINNTILEGDPHSVLEGMILAGYGIGAKKGYIYLSPEYGLTCDNLSLAIEEARKYGLLGNNILGSGFDFDLEIYLRAGNFVYGEDSSLFVSIEGRRAEPQDKISSTPGIGLFSQPTIIHNAEAFARVPSIINKGANWYTQYGTDTNKGTIVFSLAGDIVHKGIIEVPLNMSLGDVIYKIGGGIPGGKSLKAVRVGGPSGQLIPKSLLNSPMSYDSWGILQEIMNSGELTVLNEDSCMVEAARRSLEFSQSQSCGKCTPCRIGTQRLLEILERIIKGEGQVGDIELLEELSESIQLSAMCGFGENASNPILSTIQYFRQEYEEHIFNKYCRAGACADLVVSPCENACPAGINVPGYMGLISVGKYIDAYHLIRRENPFPAVCGRICTRPCESKCRRAQLDQSIAIADLKRFVSDCAFENQDSLLHEETGLPQNGKSIGIIGAGPSGLTCGYYLAKLGYQVDVYEAHGLAGGVLAFGIPEYRLPNDILNREITLIKQAGVNIHLNTEIGKQIQFSELRSKHDAIYIATGSQVANKIDVPGEELAGVIHGLDFLRSVNLGQEVQVGNVVAVIGGGNTAMDAARTALRKGAQKVMLLYRRTIDDMPADIREIHEAIEEGIEIMPLVAPVRFIGQDKIAEIECVKMELGLFDSGGRKRPQAQVGSTFRLQVDTVIPAVSQSTELPFIDTNEVSTTKWGTLLTNKDSQMTTLEGVFAGGDAARGPDVAIHAIADGKKAAAAIDRFLGGKGILHKGEAVNYPLPTDNDELHEHERYEMEVLAPEIRKKSFAEVGRGYHKLKAIAESMRCLRCDRR